MLTLEEYQFGGARNSSERIIALFQLRNSTAILIIQCLADREVQKDFYKTDSRPSAAYHYNCAVIHQPHHASQVICIAITVLRKIFCTNYLCLTDRSSERPWMGFQYPEAVGS